MPKRPDGTLLKTSKYQELEFYLMKGRNQSVIYYNTLIDLSHNFEFLDEYNKQREEKDKLSLFQIFLTACARAATLRPKINRFVSGRRLWQRNQIIFSFVVKKEKTEEGEEVNAMIEFDPFDTLETVRVKVNNHLNEARYGENPNEKDIKFFGGLPRFLIRFIIWLVRWTDEHNCPIYSITKDMPLWCSAYIAHLGSIGVDAVFHHPFEIGTASLFLNIGKVHKTTLVNQETNEVEVKKVMELRISIDDRIAGGSYTGPSVHLLKDLIEHPEPLLKPPELSDEQLDKLMLKKYKKERLEREKIRKKQKKKR